VRVAALGSRLYLHSAFPTDAPDAVFFGPDSYRFAALIERELAGVAPGSLGRVIDIGTGAGVGALVTADACLPARAIGTDVNPKALRFAAMNAAAAGIHWELDPDVFGEELAGEAYRDVDRIAVVAAVFTRRP
jgi:methylase of polypeptide subunit release factors